MLQYIPKRIIQMIPVVLGVSIIVFLIMHLAPGDPVALMFGLDAAANPELVAQIRQELGLDQPLYVQYFRFLGNLVRGDLGRSITTNRSVTGEIAARLPATLELAISATIIAVVVGIITGVLAATYRNSIFDYLSTLAALFGASIPSFWFGLMLMLVFAIILAVLPVSGRGGPIVGTFVGVFGGNPAPFILALRHLILPAITLGLPSVALITRLTRSGMLEVLGEDYIRVARSKGLSERTVIFHHALRNAMIPVTTMIGLQFGYLLGGAVITESVFAWPGVGRLVVMAIQQRDYPLVQGNVMLMALIFVTINLLVDLFYSILDPRVRYD
ncbi:MAG: ABC transporter permease [Bacillota bacterium]